MTTFYSLFFCFSSFLFSSFLFFWFALAILHTSPTLFINNMSERDLKKLATRLNNLFEAIYNIANRAGTVIYPDFQKLPSRTGTDYYKYIARPISLHTIGRNIKRFAYKDGQSFVNDLAQITWNARHYNEPGSEIYENALLLDKFIKDTAIPKLAADIKVPNHATLHYPDLGPLDEYGRFDDDGASASPYLKNDDYDDEEHSGYSHVHTKQALTPPKPVEGGVRRGRPPIIDKPYESRIKLILKLFKKMRHPDDDSAALTGLFEKLPDKSAAGYYDVVARPLLLTEIRTKVRSRKYTDVQQFLDDLSLMISNAKLYYGADAATARDIALFEKQAETIVEKEMARPEKDFIVAAAAGADGLKTPLDSVTVRGHTYKVGDWVLIRNPNDANKPICGQMFRLWTADGVQYTNVCWYIRPEQTVHRVDRLFYVNEVCKTGEYRDHLVADIVAPCYVIFLTHYQKGDIPPNLLPPGTDWFICEFRYNANTYQFNRIRTWKACLPDEIRHVDQPIVPINEPRRLIKYDLPLRQLLPPDATDDMPVTGPTPGPHSNGPPVVGAVYRKPPFYNDELGQCLTSPNVTPAPEYDDPATGRKAYVFTPVSQLKSVTGLGIYLLSGTRSVPVSYVPNGDDTLSYDSYKPYLNKSYPYQRSGYAKTSYPPGTAYKPYVKPYRDLPVEGGRGVSPYAQVYATATSIYLSVLPGGTVSYVEAESEEAMSVSALMVAHDGRTVWFRAPPVKVSARVATPVGHTARYLAWKAKKQQR